MDIYPKITADCESTAVVKGPNKTVRVYKEEKPIQPTTDDKLSVWDVIGGIILFWMLFGMFVVFCGIWFVLALIAA